MWIDTHCHLNDEQLYPIVDEVVNRAQMKGVHRMLNASADLASSLRGIEVAGRFEDVYTSIGLHPHEADSYDDAFAEEMIRLAKEPKVVAYGEIGLDYHYEYAPRDVQKKVFVEQIALANELELPVIIHNRESHQDMLEILKANPIRHGAVMHCFSGSREFARECLKLGLYISFAGPITFKNARRLPEVVADIPMERILTETDSPYLTPEPFRGKTNEPMHVVEVAEKICEIQEIEKDHLAENVQKNVRELFGFW